MSYFGSDRQFVLKLTSWWCPLITIIAVDEQNQQIKINAKSLAIVDLETFVCDDEAAAELLAKALEENQQADLAQKIRKLTSVTPSEE